MKKKTRLDVLLVERGLLKHEKKQSERLWLALFIQMKRLDKPGEKVNEDIPLIH